MTTVMSEIGPLHRNLQRHFDSQPAPDAWLELFDQVAKSQPTPEPWVKLFEHVAQHERLYHALLGKKGSFWFVTNMRASHAETLSERFQALAYALNNQRITESQVFADGFVPALIAAQLVDAITWWLEQGKPYTPRQNQSRSWLRQLVSRPGPRG
jgi:hypothetical protein